HPPNCMFSCLQILEAFLWFVLITLLNVTLIILTLSVSRLLNLLLRLVAFLLFLNPQCLASISRWITASSSWKRFCLFVCRALSSIMVICMLTAIRLLLTFVMSLYLLLRNEVDLVHQQTQNQRYGSSHIGATAKDISNVVTDAASGVVDIFHGIDKAVADTWNNFWKDGKADGIGSNLSRK